MGRSPRQIRGSEKHVLLGQVMHEDDEFVYLKISKDMDAKFHLEPNDRFFSLVFVRNVSKSIFTWNPFTGERR